MPEGALEGALWHGRARRLIIPVRPGDKVPHIKDWVNQASRDSAQIRRWFMRWPGAWIGVVCGADSAWIVIDLDRHAGGADGLAAWRQLEAEAGYATPTLYQDTPSGGRHLIFRHPGFELRNSAGSLLPAGIDVRGDGGYVVVAPTPGYVWHDAPVADLPDWLLARFSAQAPAGERSRAPTSLLSELLEHPPAEGERNEHMTKIVGHLVKGLPAEDAVLANARAINTGWPAPLPDEELRKMVAGLWRKDASGTSQPALRSQPAPDTGDLAGDGQRIWIHTKNKAEPWSDFDIRAKVHWSSGERSYYGVQLRVAGEQQAVDYTLPGSVLGSNNELFRWLGARRAGLMPGQQRSASERLRLYLKSHNPVHQAEISWLGDNDGVFICPDGTTLPPSDRRFWLEDRLRQAPYRYGLGDRAVALDVLRQVLSFHDEMVCSVFGAWWAMIPLKRQVMLACSMFPLMALQGASESGKTTGFFALMRQLLGHMGSAGGGTKPALRDEAALNRCGIVWLDDVTDLGERAEMLRLATSEEVWHKKAADNTTTTTIPLVSAIMLSGEDIPNMASERALPSRTIQLEVPYVKDRRSLADPGRLQWHDVMALRAAHDDDLCSFAGTLVCEIRVMAPQAQLWLDEFRVGAGRAAELVAMLRTGARVLAALTQDEAHVARVDEWCAAYRPDERDMLFRVILPRIVRTWMAGGGLPPRAIGGCPVFLEDGRLWIHVGGVADWWRRETRSSRELQLGSEASIRRQLAVAGVLEIRRCSILQSRSRGQVDQQRRCHGLTPAQTAEILAEAGAAIGASSDDTERLL